MSFLAPYKTAFQQIEALYHLSEYTVNRSTKTVWVLLAVYKDPDSRAAHKAANAKTEELNKEIDAIVGKQAKLLADFRALPLEERQDQQRAQFDADVNVLDAELRRLQVGVNGAVQRARQNEPGDMRRIDIKPGAIAFDDAGNINVADIYAWLKANHFIGAKDV